MKKTYLKPEIENYGTSQVLLAASVPDECDSYYNEESDDEMR